MYHYIICLAKRKLTWRGIKIKSIGGMKDMWAIESDYPLSKGDMLMGPGNEDVRILAKYYIASPSEGKVKISSSPEKHILLVKIIK